MLTTRADKCYYDHYLRNKVFIKNTQVALYVSLRKCRIGYSFALSIPLFTLMEIVGFQTILI